MLYYSLHKNQNFPFSFPTQKSPEPPFSMALSNNIISILNFIFLLSSIPILISSIYLFSNPKSACIHLLQWPLLILSLLLLLLSLAGFIGSYFNLKFLLSTYLFFMATLIVLLLAFLVFSFVITIRDGAYDVKGRGFKEYRLAGFSDWIKKYVGDEGNWVRIRDCVVRFHFCGKIARDERGFSSDQFFSSDLNPIQSGCCKPPTACGYAYVNPTVWVSPTNVGADPDCYAWSNDQTQLCYGCNSCKAGTIGNLRDEWRKANIVLIVAAVALIFVYVIGCCAFRNAQTEELFERYKQGFA